MKSREKYVSSTSNYFLHLPSLTARKTFFYPICVGDFLYEPGYFLKRDAYDSFLLMYIQKGCVTLEHDGRKEIASEGNFVLLDCYHPHSYYSDTDWECLWLHFDGPSARAYYDLVNSQLGSVFNLPRYYIVVNKMLTVYHTFLHGEPIKEPVFSKIITDILTTLLLCTDSAASTVNDAGVIEEIVSYIQEHYTEDITIQQLADRAMISQYHFIRVFKKETGFTPHEYILNIRISTAKYMLKTTHMSVKDICFSTGFSNVSVFCTSFKRKTGLTPAEYRNSASNP